MSRIGVTDNSYTHGTLPKIFAKTALPIILVMSVHGLMTLIDAIFLGIFVGPEALGAVTLMFPVYMLIVALTSLVTSGMSSLLARYLGGQKYDEAQGVFAGAHGMGLTISFCLIAVFLAFGREITLFAANGSAPLAELGHIYLSITIIFTPLVFMLSINSDALRSEGRIGFMAAMSLLASFANIGFNYILIVQAELGIAGSAYGTVLANALAFFIIFIFRLKGQTHLKLTTLLQYSPQSAWRKIFALGAPQSLNFIGVALVSAVIIAALQFVSSSQYDATVAAYGIITRITIVALLPILGMAHALQAIAGNNYGASLWDRSSETLRFGISISLIYCLALEIILIGFARPIAMLFVSDLAVVEEVSRIMPVMFALFLLTGPLIMIAIYFQAIGDTWRAAILGLAKPYAFATPLIFLLAYTYGEDGIWLAGPASELLLLGLTAIMLIGAVGENNPAFNIKNFPPIFRPLIHKYLSLKSR